MPYFAYSSKALNVPFPNMEQIMPVNTKPANQNNIQSGKRLSLLLPGLRMRVIVTSGLYKLLHFTVMRGEVNTIFIDKFAILLTYMMCVFVCVRVGVRVCVRVFVRGSGEVHLKNWWDMGG